MMSLKWCIVSIAMLSSPAEGGDSMVCGKPSIREVLKKDTRDVSAQTWADISKTGEKQVKDMAALVEKTNQELLALEAEAAAKKGESSVSSLSVEESKGLIEKTFSSGGTFPSAEKATLWDCGYGMAAFD